MNTNLTKKGSALATTVLIIAVLSAAMAALLKFSVTERRINYRHQLRTQASNTAEAVVEYGFAQLSYVFDNKTSVNSDSFDSNVPGALSLPPASSLRDNIDYSKFKILSSAVPNSALEYIDPTEPDNQFDPLKGKFVRSLDVTLYGSATVTDPKGGSDLSSHITQTFQVRDSPLFSHAIFYNLVLDIHAGPKMDIYGPVHTNGDLRLAPVNGIDFHSTVSTAGDIYHHHEHEGNTSRTGGIRIPDEDNNLLPLKDGSVWNDSTMGDGSTPSDAFRSYASNRWEGNLLTSAHGITAYNPVAFADYQEDDPGTATYDPVNSGRDIIEKPLPLAHADYNSEIEAQKMSNKAGLYFRWDTTTSRLTAYDKDSNALDISQLEGTLWEHKDQKLRDRRRGQFVDTIDIHTGHLKQLIESPNTSDTTLHIGGYTPATDWNGVVYVECYSSDSNPTAAAELNNTGIRLFGGDTDEVGQGIPSLGFDPGMSFVTNNALYIQGNFNADGVTNGTSSHLPETNEVPVAVMGDSVSFLSKNWSDSHYAPDSDTGNVSNTKPNADTTEYAIAVVGGIRPGNVQGDGSLSGGNENFPRFLEKWSGKTFYLRGSLVCLYESEVDFSQWNTSNYYSPPNRAYGFNDLFKNGTYPPGTPLLRTYRRTSYESMSKAEFTTATSSL